MTFCKRSFGCHLPVLVFCHYHSRVNLSVNEARVLGSLIEKDITTPDNYPLSLNSLVNACNQKSNRDPVMTLDEDTVRAALNGLGHKNLAGPARGADSRVPKFEHRVYDALKIGRREIAILCELLIRGPQTPGELRSRAERMHHFEDLSDIQATLHRLIEWDPPLAAMLPRIPGTKESRFAHLMSGEVPAAALEHHAIRSVPDARSDRVGNLEAEIQELRAEIAEIKRQFAEFRKQFE